MRDKLAEWLLAKVMEWSPADVARERPLLQAMAAFKYDEYQQFFPGMRFVESLANWLSQFANREERTIAYEFVKKHLVFCSSAEMNHLVTMAYPDFVRPVLQRRVATELRVPARFVKRVANSVQFRVAQRRCLFLGLSDGARIDVFRRSNNPELSHEQILPTYDISPDRVMEALGKLRADLTSLLGSTPPEELCKFGTIVLLDDFSASGVSYLRKNAAGQVEGKLEKFRKRIADPKEPSSALADLSRSEVIVLLYMATEQARAHLEGICREIWAPSGANCSVQVVHPLRAQLKIAAGDGNLFGTLLEKYYDPTIETESSKKGGTDLKYGFAACGLPLVLSHNTPNNSVYLLWAESKKLRALFPRVDRHRKEA